MLVLTFVIILISPHTIKRRLDWGIAKFIEAHLWLNLFLKKEINFFF